MPFPGIIPARYTFAVLGSIGFAIIYGLKVNLSVAIVAMVNHTALASASAIQHSDSSDASQVETYGGPSGECAGDAGSVEILVGELLEVVV